MTPKRVLAIMTYASNLSYLEDSKNSYIPFLQIN